MTATILALSQTPGESPQQSFMTKNLAVITQHLCIIMLSEDTCIPSTVSTVEAVAAIIFLCCTAVLLDAFLEYLKGGQRTNPQDIFLQRQLNIAKRNRVANSLAPAHETMPARMRIRIMKAQAEKQEELGEIKGKNEDEILGMRIEVWRKNVDDGSGRRVRFAGDVGSER